MSLSRQIALLSVCLTIASFVCLGASPEGQRLGLVANFRTATDSGGRFLTTDAPSNSLDHPGTVILDFNQAVNPPCAYSPFATCPLAAKENRLPVAIPAGEKRYED